MEFYMKKLVSCMLILVAFSSWALNRGINYDPAHSKVYTDAQVSNNIQTMKNEITKDFQTAKKNGFTTVKTFYSIVSTVNGKNTAMLADIACPMGVKLLLGVYEFDPNKDNCSTWCDAARAQQVSAAIASVNKYNANGGNCILGIVVGNEDVYNWNFTQANDLVQSHISADLTTIKNGLTYFVPLTTAQQDGALLKLAMPGNDPHGIIPKLDFVGANIYPYWSSPENPNFPVPAQTEFYNRYHAVTAAYTQMVAVTEEGWPSQYNAGQNPHATLPNEKAYYTWWQNRATGAGGTTKDTFDSFYFALYDNQPLTGDANNFFGLCTYNRGNKVLTACG
jgi:exo-beta-1,3-glucanase (GH17 family)